MTIRRVIQSAGVPILFAIFLATLSLTVPYFAGWSNIQALLQSIATIGILSCTMLFCLVAGDFDLSVGSIVAFCGVLAALILKSEMGIALAILLPLIAGALIGTFNGFVIAKLKINALIATLATMQIVRGVGLIISNGSSIGISDPTFSKIGQTLIIGIPSPIWVMLVSFVVFGFVLKRTIFGRNSLAIGGNSEAARLAGISVEKTKIIIFALQGLMAGIAGILLASRVTSGQPTTAQGLELQVISACVLGGVSLSGGVGTMTGAIIGVLFMGTVDNVMTLLNVESFYKMIISGGILLLAVLFDKLKRRNK